MLGRNEGYDDYKDFMIRLLTPIYEDLGFDNKESDSLMDQQLRPKVAKAMCELEHKVSINTSSSLNLWWLVTHITPQYRYWQLKRST